MPNMTPMVTAIQKAIGIAAAVADEDELVACMLADDSTVKEPDLRA